MVYLYDVDGVKAEISRAAAEGREPDLSEFPQDAVRVVAPHLVEASEDYEVTATPPQDPPPATPVSGVDGGNTPVEQINNVDNPPATDEAPADSPADQAPAENLGAE